MKIKVTKTIQNKKNLKSSYLRKREQIKTILEESQQRFRWGRHTEKLAFFINSWEKNKAKLLGIMGSKNAINRIGVEYYILGILNALKQKLNTNP